MIPFYVIKIYFLVHDLFDSSRFESNFQVPLLRKTFRMEIRNRIISLCLLSFLFCCKFEKCVG